MTFLNSSRELDARAFDPSRLRAMRVRATDDDGVAILISSHRRRHHSLFDVCVLDAAQALRTQAHAHSIISGSINYSRQSSDTKFVMT